ncbi:MAG TPA: DUF5695 domain-containing protein [Fimbriimonadaceae bacterium]|nr:DUF5695 domain-containing protein [Fimbriimonadaceae bacterium]
MDEYHADRAELNGTLISMEFGPQGRIQQLWVSDPNLPEEGEEFQFVLTPISFGGEFAEDYYPGTILLGARTEPNEPWILSRSRAMPQGFPEEDDEDGPPPDLSSVSFDYDFSLLPEIAATGRYYEILSPLPQIVWEVRLENRGRISIEIGELAFPFPLNNLYEGYGRTDQDLKNLWHERVYVHKYIGGAASYLYAQRMNDEPPGLVIFPGDDTSWEFFAHVRSSLNTAMSWEGIPVVYVHSRAATEREGWGSWFNEHTSLILEPGDSRTYQTRFVPAERNGQESIQKVLAACGVPIIRLLPGAVAPAEVGIACEISGATPARFFVNREANVETDADEEGGFCFIRPAESGPLRLSMEDTRGRRTHAHLLFIDSIEDLIIRRAQWIVDHQVHDEPGSVLHQAILPVDIRTGDRLTHPDHYALPFAIQASLGDALFLCEKNRIYPDPEQTAVLDRYLFDFVRNDLQNPSDHTVGSAFADLKSVAVNYGRTSVYPLVFSLYHAMYRLAKTHGATQEDASFYLDAAGETAMAMFRYGIPSASRGIGIRGYPQIFELVQDLAAEGFDDTLKQLQPLVRSRAQELLKRHYPFGGESVWDTAGFADVYAEARHLASEEHQERTFRCAYATRSLAPSWWWYGSDKRIWQDPDYLLEGYVGDRGELCLGHTSAGNSSLFFSGMERDYEHLAETAMRQAFGGLLGVWALVGPDGAAAMAFCPDAASRHFGANGLTGDIGLALYEYLRVTGAYVLPSRSYGVFTFGCHFEADENAYKVRPWDGVGRRVVMRQIGAEFELSAGKIRSVTLDVRKRWANVELENPGQKALQAQLVCRGLWGRRLAANKQAVESVNGEMRMTVALEPRNVAVLEVKVTE